MALLSLFWAPIKNLFALLVEACLKHIWDGVQKASS